MIYQILRIAVDVSRQMLFLETCYKSLEQQKEYYHVNKNIDPASRGHIKNARFNVIATQLKYLKHVYEMFI